MKMDIVYFLETSKGRINGRYSDHYGVEAAFKIGPQ